jgi:hypothetical protein
MEKVRKLIEAGARTGVAIREALLVDRQLTVAAFAEKHDLPEKSVSNGINGNVRVPRCPLSLAVNPLNGRRCFGTPANLRLW